MIAENDLVTEFTPRSAPPVMAPLEDDPAADDGIPETVETGFLDYTVDSIRMYLREMGAIPRLSPERQKEVAQEIHDQKIRLLESLSRDPRIVQEVIHILEQFESEELYFDDHFYRRTSGKEKSVRIKLQELAEEIRKASPGDENLSPAEAGELDAWRSYLVACVMAEMVPEARLKLIRIFQESGKEPEGLAPYEAAMKMMVASNLRLVVSEAKKHQFKGVDFLDLIQEGNLGLMRAADKFDPRLGFQFSTFATQTIAAQIQRAVLTSRHSIHLALHIIELKPRFLKTFKEMAKEFGHYPTNREVAQRMLAKYDLPGNIDTMTEKIIELKIWLDNSTISLDQPLDKDGGENSDLVFGETLPDKAPDALKLATHVQSRELLAKLLQVLPPRSYMVVCMRYGIGGMGQLAFPEIAEKLGLRREQVRSSHDLGLRRLRHPDHEDLLKALRGIIGKKETGPVGGTFPLPGAYETVPA